eukprot:1767999-Pleurochrysis_carterae.AAC.1
MRLRRGIAVLVVHKVLLPDRVVGGHPSGARRRRDGWLGGRRSGVDGGGRALTAATPIGCRGVKVVAGVAVGASS